MEQLNVQHLNLKCLIWLPNAGHEGSKTCRLGKLLWQPSQVISLMLTGSRFAVTDYVCVSGRCKCACRYRDRSQIGGLTRKPESCRASAENHSKMHLDLGSWKKWYKGGKLMKQIHIHSRLCATKTTEVSLEKTHKRVRCYTVFNHAIWQRMAESRQLKHIKHSAGHLDCNIFDIDGLCVSS